MEEMDQKYRNRLVLLLIAGIPVTMILGATWLWYFVVRGDLDLISVLGTANRGALIEPPRQIDDAELLDQNGAAIRYPELGRKWTMLVPGAGGLCDTICEGKLYLTRQLHVALGKEYNRLARLYLSESRAADTELAVNVLSDQRPAPASFAALLAGEHRGLEALTVGPGDFERMFAEFRRDPSTWYLVDPDGWIMMSYNNEINYKEVIADLKFLLKNSSE